MIRRALKLLRSLTRTESKVKNKIAWRLFQYRLQRQQLVNQAFDRCYGTETADEIPLMQTGVPAEQAARGNGNYQPSGSHNFHAAFAALNPRHGD
jgi:hypothetical protein